MQHLCCQCGHVFTDREAECENWEDPARSFICPACHTYLIPNYKMKAPWGFWVDRFKRQRRHVPKAALGVFVLLLLLRLDKTVGVIASIIAVAGLVLYGLFQPWPPEITHRADERSFDA